MAAELISIWGRGFLSMTDEEFASAREEGYTGPQQTLLLMEIGDESNVVDVNVSSDRRRFGRRFRSNDR